jgi:hypothetical protein
MSAIKQLNRLAATAKTSVLKPASKQILLPTAGQQAAIRMMGQTRAASTEGGATNVSIFCVNDTIYTRRPCACGFAMRPEWGNSSVV